MHRRPTTTPAKLRKNVSGPMSRAAFLRGIGAAAAGAGLGIIGRGRVAHAFMLNPDPANVIDPRAGMPAVGGEVEIWVYPSGDAGTLLFPHPWAGDRGLPVNSQITRDARNVQWAVDNVLAGGTIVLRKSKVNETLLTSFQFGKKPTVPSGPYGGGYGVRMIQDVILIGETDGLPTAQFPNGTPLTAVEGGAGTFGTNNPKSDSPLRCGYFNNPPRIRLENIAISNPCYDGGLVAALFFQYFNASIAVNNCRIQIDLPQSMLPANVTQYNSMGIFFRVWNQSRNVRIALNPYDEPLRFTNNEISLQNVYTGAIGGGYFCAPNPLTVIADNNAINCLGKNANPVAALVLHGNFRNSMITDNKIRGVTNTGIRLYSATIPTGSFGPSNTVVAGNDLSQLTATRSQVRVESPSTGNYFGPDDKNGIPPNAFGPITSEALAGIEDYGFNNNYVMNDFKQSGIQGLKSSDQPCVYLASPAHDNFVLQSGTFPAGTGGAKEQVVDMMRELTGSTTNRIVGHPANFLAENIRPGIGLRLQAIEAQLAEPADPEIGNCF